MGREAPLIVCGWPTLPAGSRSPCPCVACVLCALHSGFDRADFEFMNTLTRHFFLTPLILLDLLDGHGATKYTRETRGRARERRDPST